jgi:hypothetical protein
MLKMVAATVLAVPVAMAGAAAATGIMVVDVNPGDGPRIVVPVPLGLAQMALSFVPEQELDIDDHDLDELREHLPEARELIRAIIEAPDGEFVRVEERNGTLVTVAKRGGALEVYVDDDEDHVEVTVPLGLAERALEDVASGRVRPAALLSELRSYRWTDLVEVHSGEDHVRIWMF